MNKLEAKDIKEGDEVVVNCCSYFVEDIDEQGNFTATGNDGEEISGNLDSIDAHFTTEDLLDRNINF